MSMEKASELVWTGRHVLIVMCLFFGVIIAVNVTMAYLATSSWTGLVERTQFDDARLKLRDKTRDLAE